MSDARSMSQTASLCARASFHNYSIHCLISYNFIALQYLQDIFALSLASYTRSYQFAFPAQMYIAWIGYSCFASSSRHSAASLDIRGPQFWLSSSGGACQSHAELASSLYGGTSTSQQLNAQVAQHTRSNDKLVHFVKKRSLGAAAEGTCPWSPQRHSQFSLLLPKIL